MDTINIFDSNGVLKMPPSKAEMPKQINIVKGKNNFNGTTIFTDMSMRKAAEVKSKYKIALLLEPRTVRKYTYDNISKYQHLFNLILTFDQQLLKNKKKFVFAPFGTSWINTAHQKIYNKKKKISIIASQKKYLGGHKVRHSFASIPGIDKYGKITGKYIPLKVSGLKDYMFSVAVENCSVPNYFSEKLIDCFLCGCVPVYWGCTNIHKFFNIDGMILAKNKNQLQKMMPRMNMKLYTSMLPAIQDNFERAKNYTNIFDWIHTNILLPRKMI